VLVWLTESADLPTQELLRRAKEKGYAGNKTAFYAMVAGIRPSRSTPVVRFEGLPGEFSPERGEPVTNAVGEGDREE
jgi:hypothetical protein